eukprot:1086093-Prymnesium_polylepis.1
MPADSAPPSGQARDTHTHLLNTAARCHRAHGSARSHTLTRRTRRAKHSVRKPQAKPTLQL